MPVATAAVGRTYAAVTYAVGREKIREYARAVGETNALHLDLTAARAAGHRDLVAPPMFAVVYAGSALGAPIVDPDLAIDFSRLVHGSQEFVWGPLVVAGDEIETVASVASVEERAGNGFYTFETVSTNQDGQVVCRGTWMNVVRGG
jgi:acyl dehydratase